MRRRREVAGRNDARHGDGGRGRRAGRAALQGGQLRIGLSDGTKGFGRRAVDGGRVLAIVGRSLIPVQITLALQRMLVAVLDVVFPSAPEGAGHGRKALGATDGDVLDLKAGRR